MTNKIHGIENHIISEEFIITLSNFHPLINVFVIRFSFIFKWFYVKHLSLGYDVAYLCDRFCLRLILSVYILFFFVNSYGLIWLDKLLFVKIGYLSYCNVFVIEELFCVMRMAGQTPVDCGCLCLCVYISNVCR